MGMEKSSLQRIDNQPGLQRKFSCRTLVYSIAGLTAAGVIFKLLSYRSAEPWIFGLYSLPYFLFVIVFICGSLFLAFTFVRFRLKTIYFLIAWVVVAAIFVGAIEIGGQIYAFVYPAYRVLSFVPDRMVGWKLLPNLRYTWGGHYWYAREFSVPIAINSHGYRDAERTLSKPRGVTRVALLGDSMVEAMQVPFEKTAGHVLEQTLNTRAEGKPAAYEVLNFGVSNYGVGQYLLTWEEYASKFSPDYVFILVAEIHMDRTVTKYESSAVSATERRLWVRPTFRIEKNELVREPARDFDQFVKAQQELIDGELGGKRSARRSHGVFIAPYANLSLWQRLMEVQRRLSGQLKVAEAEAEAFQPLDRSVADINLKVIEELGRQIRDRGGRLVVVDASRYFRFLKWQALTPMLKQFCAEHGFGFIPLGDELLTAEKNGTVTRWPYDQHFNEIGNKIFADAMYRWISTNVREPKAKAPL